MHDRDAFSPADPQALWSADQVQIAVTPSIGGALVQVSGPSFAAFLIAFLPALHRPSYASSQGWFILTAHLPELETWLRDHVEESAVTWAAA